MTTEGLKERLKYIKEEIESYEEAKQQIEQEIYRKKYLDKLHSEPKSDIFDRHYKLHTLAKVLAKVWFYEDLEAQTPNERVLQMLMEDLGLFPFKDEDDMIAATKVDENLYKEARERAEKPKITTLKMEWIKWKDKAACEGAVYVSMDSFINHMAEEYDLTRK